MKKVILGIIIGALLMVAFPVSAAIEEFILYRADYKLMINGTEYADAELPLLNYKGYTYAPVRSVFEAAGLDVDWNAELYQASVTTPPENYGKSAGGMSGEETQHIINQDWGWEGSVLDGFDSVKEMQDFYGVPTPTPTADMK